MKIAFIDSQELCYDVNTPFNEPLGGSHSALCYLTIALAERGHQVTLINNNPAPGMVRGVNGVALNSLTTDYFEVQKFDCLIALNSPFYGSILKPVLPENTQFILWVQHAHDQPAVKELIEPTQQRLWNKIVCISQWQKSCYEENFKIPENKIMVLRNAIAPVFEGLFDSIEDLKSIKATPIQLVYTSTPFRGLHILLPLFSSLKQKNPQLMLKIFSSMRVYQVEEKQDQFQALYDQCRFTAGIDYMGSISQKNLAQQLKYAHFLTYPNTFAETSCIAVAEAMAAGCYVVTSDLGALSETTAGFASLVPMEPEDSYAQRYLHQLTNDLADYTCEKQWEQIQYMNHSYTWSQRAEEWEIFLTRQVNNE